MELSLKELVKLILHIPGLIILAVIILLVVGSFFDTSSSAEKEAEMFANRLENALSQPGDFTQVSLDWEVFKRTNKYVSLKEVILTEKGTDGKPSIKLRFFEPFFTGSSFQPFSADYFGSYYADAEIESEAEVSLDFPVCSSEKKSSSACIKRTQSLTGFVAEDSGSKVLLISENSYGANYPSLSGFSEDISINFRVAKDGHIEIYFDSYYPINQVRGS